MSGKNKEYGGFLLTEIIVSLTILEILLIGLALSLHGFAKFNRYQLVRQRCIAAAQAELDSIAVTGKQIGQEDFKQLWPNLSVSIEESVGVGQWEGMKLIKVTTSGKSPPRRMKVELCRYILAEREQ